MSTLMALRLLAQTVKNTKALKNHGNLYRLHMANPPTTQLTMTKIPMTTNTSSSNQVNNNSDEWRIIYRFPLINLASAFNRLKISYGFFNGIAIPAAFALEQATQFPPSTSFLVGIVGLSSWCTLAVISLLFKNLVGIIYINDNSDKLKLAYVDYWGKRHDVCIELEDLIPQSEKSGLFKPDFYQSLRLHSDNKVKYKLVHQHGLIEDIPTFVAIFGE